MDDQKALEDDTAKRLCPISRKRARSRPSVSADTDPTAHLSWTR